MPLPEIIRTMRRLNTGEHAPVWEEEDEDMHDSSSRSLLTEGLRKRTKQPITTNLGPTLSNGQTRKRKRVTFAVPAPIPAKTNQDHTMSIINKLTESEPNKRPKQNPFTALSPVYAVVIGTKTDPRKPMLNSEVGMNEPSDSRNRMLSDLIRALDRQNGRRTRNRPELFQWPSPEQQAEANAAASSQDMQKNQQTRKRDLSSASTEHEERETDLASTNDPEDEHRDKWHKIPGQIWRNTTAFFANTVNHLPFYTSLKEKQWQEATNMWQQEAINKRMGVHCTTKNAKNPHHISWLRRDRI